MDSKLNSAERDILIDVLVSVAGSTCGFHMLTGDEGDAVHELLNRLREDSKAPVDPAKYSMAVTGRDQTAHENLSQGSPGFDRSGEYAVLAETFKRRQ